MILANISGNGATVQVAVKGSVDVIAADLSLLIHNIYSELAKDDKEAADEFKLYMKSVVAEDFLFMNPKDALEAMEKSLKDDIEANTEGGAIKNFEQLAKGLMG